MKKKYQKNKRLSLLMGLVFLCITTITGCTVTRQLSAAEILKKTDLEFESLSLDSITVYSDQFPKSKGFLPDPQVILFVQNLTKGIIEKEVGKIYLTAGARATNKHEKTLSLRSLNAELKLDSIVTLPMVLKDSMQLAPGANHISINTIMPIDGSLFHLMETDTIYFAGRLEVSLQGDDVVVPLDFSIKKYVSPDEKKKLQEQASRQVVDTIVDKLLGSRK